VRGRTHAASAHPDGTLLAVNVADDPAADLHLFAIGADGRLGTRTDLAWPDTDAFARHVEWSPDGRFLLATFPPQHEVRFYRVRRDGAAPALEPWGEPMVTGKLAGVGHWAPDGRHAVVTNLYWLGGADDLYVGAQWSTLSVVAFDAEAGRHRVVANAPVGGSAEEFAISPDGRRVATLNMQSSFLPPGDPRLTFHSSITLLDLEPATGLLTPRHTLPFESILPEGITFDASGRHLAVASFASFNPARPTAETTVEFFRVVDGPQPLVVQMDLKVPVMRGAHIVKVVP
jgi:hypothetical protein